MNILDVQNKLKNLSQEQLIKEMQAPSGAAPQFLVLSELTRRTRMRSDLMAQQQQGQDKSVAEEAVAAAGVPQAGLGSMARAMAPNTDITQNSGIGALPQAPQRMAEGGMLGGNSYAAPPLAFLRDPAIQAMATRMGVRPGELWRQMPESVRMAQEARLSNQGRPPAGPVTRDQYLDQITSAGGVNPSYDPVAVEQETRPGFAMPPQADLDRRYADSITPWIPDISSPPADVAPFVPRAMADGPQPAMALPDMVDLDLVGEAPQLRAADLPTGGLPLPKPRTPADEIYARTQANIPAMLAPLPPNKPAAAPPESVSGAARRLDSMFPGTGYQDVMRGGPRMPPAAQEVPAQAEDPSLWDRIFSTEPDPEVLAKLDERVAQAEERRAETEAAAAEAAGEAGASAGNGLPTSPVGGGDVTGAGGASSSAPMSSYEQELVDAIKRAEKRAEQDKWLALAQAGMALMASKQPTLGGALGEAGMTGLGAFRESRDAAEAEKMKLLEAQFGVQLARQKASAGGGRGGVSGGVGGVGGFKSLDQAFDNLMKMSEYLGGAIADPSITNAARLQLQAQKEQVDAQLGGIFGLMSGQPTAGADFNAQQ